MENQLEKKPRILCLHGFRTSGNILKKQIDRWPESVFQKAEFVYLDAKFPASGKSDVEGIFDPPYFEWFGSNEDFTEFYNFEECLHYIEDYMVNHGPFDGVLGFSQVLNFIFPVLNKGAILAAALPGMKLQELGLKNLASIKFIILISAAKMGGPTYGSPKLAQNAFSSPINCPSLHFIGDTDFHKDEGLGLLKLFVNPVVLHHPKGHTIPRLDQKNIEIMLDFVGRFKSCKNDESI